MDRYKTSSSDFDGTNDFQQLGGGLTGIADGKAGTVSAWCRLDGGNASSLSLFSSNFSPAKFGLFRTSSNKFQVTGANVAGITILTLTTSTSYTSGTTWLNVLSSWDLAAGVGHFYINDVSDSTGPVLTNDTIDYSMITPNWFVGATNAAGSRFNGCLSEIFFHTTYIDLSVLANRRKFIGINGKPAFLGADGSLPLGVQPFVYAPNGDASGSGNKGIGGAFTTVGSLDVGSTSPSD